METGVMNAECLHQSPYALTGTELSRDGKTLMLDTQEPRIIIVNAVNERTGKKKEYLLRIAQNGSVVLL